MPGDFTIIPAMHIDLGFHILAEDVPHTLKVCEVKLTELTEDSGDETLPSQCLSRHKHRPHMTLS